MVERCQRSGRRGEPSNFTVIAASAFGLLAMTEGFYPAASGVGLLAMTLWERL